MVRTNNTKLTIPVQIQNLRSSWRISPCLSLPFIFSKQVHYLANRCNFDSLELARDKLMLSMAVQSREALRHRIGSITLTEIAIRMTNIVKPVSQGGTPRHRAGPRPTRPNPTSAADTLNPCHREHRKERSIRMGHRERRNALKFEYAVGNWNSGVGVIYGKAGAGPAAGF
jgi:hypothetical protein